MSDTDLSARRVAVLGAGRQGTCAAFDLLRYGNASAAILVDADGSALERAGERLAGLVPGRRIELRRADGGDVDALAGALEGAATAVCALPYRFGPSAAEAAIRVRCHLVDLGGNSGVSARILALDGAARRAGVALVPDTGLAPGLANTLAAAGLAELADADSVRIWCGGLPERPFPPLGYRLVFSFGGLANEYGGAAEYLRDGTLVAVPALSELETLELPGVGAVEAFPTSGGTSTAPRSFVGRLRRYEYRTVRWPGHHAMVRPLAELGLFDDAPIDLRPGLAVSPRAVLERLLAPRLERPDVPDLVVLRVEVRGRRDGAPAGIVYDMLDREDRELGLTAMERSTAHPAAVVAEMAACGEIPPGGVRLETGVPPGPFLARMARRPLTIQTTRT